MSSQASYPLFDDVKVIIEGIHAWVIHDKTFQLISGREMIRNFRRDQRQRNADRNYELIVEDEKEDLNQIWYFYIPRPNGRTQSGFVNHNSIPQVVMTKAMKCWSVTMVLRRTGRTLQIIAGKTGDNFAIPYQKVQVRHYNQSISHPDPEPLDAFPIASSETFFQWFGLHYEDQPLWITDLKTNTHHGNRCVVNVLTVPDNFVNDVKESDFVSEHYEQVGWSRYNTLMRTFQQNDVREMRFVYWIMFQTLKQLKDFRVIPLLPQVSN